MRHMEHSALNERLRACLDELLRERQERTEAELQSLRELVWELLRREAEQSQTREMEGQAR